MINVNNFFEFLQQQSDDKKNVTRWAHTTHEYSYLCLILTTLPI